MRHARKQEKHTKIRILICSVLVICIVFATTLVLQKNKGEDYYDSTPVSPVKKGEIDKIMNDMTLEEKVCQMFMVRVPDTGAVKLVKNYQFGGYILFADSFVGKSKKEVQNTIQSYQDVAKIPLLIGTDEEGGLVNRVSKYFRSSPFDSPQEIFQAGGYDGIIANTTEKSEFLQEFGINVNFAPVADVSTNPNDFMYARTFGKGGDSTANYVKKVVKAMKEAKEGSVLKHFPGYGNNGDTHVTVIRDERPYSQFEKNDFVPFKAGIEVGADCVLVNHNIVKCMDDSFPASLSLKVHQILRDKLEFNGVIMTDDLMMGGITEFGDSSTVAVQAVLAGNDMLLSGDAVVQSKAVIVAVQEGKISEEQINQSVRRVLSWKQNLGLL